MSDEEGYNGWSNRETWAINLHLENNKGDYNQMLDAAKEILSEEHTPGTMAFTSAVGAMANYVKEWTEEVFSSVVNYPDGAEDCWPPSQEARMFVADVGSWWRADFYEIAESWINQAKEG